MGTETMTPVDATHVGPGGVAYKSTGASCWIWTGNVWSLIRDLPAQAVEIKRVMDIDWSKAPEGATHYDPLDNNWLRQVVGKALVWCGGGTGWGEKTWQYNNDLSTIRRLIVRALPWSGEGLPPVGTVCENNNGSYWVKVLIVAHDIVDGENRAVFRFAGEGMESYYGEPASEFRPIRTADQIAAEERKNGIRAMMGAIGFSRSVLSNKDCEILWDAGYRPTSS